MSITIRPMTKDDIDSVYDIEASCFEPPWSKESFVVEIEGNNFGRYVVALKDSEIIGYGGVWLIINESHITNIAVNKHHRKQKVGTLVLKALMKIAWDTLEIKKMTLEVRKSNHVAQKLYRKYGFIAAGERIKYYENNEDAVIMWCEDFTPYL